MGSFLLCIEGAQARAYKRKLVLLLRLGYLEIAGGELDGFPSARLILHRRSCQLVSQINDLAADKSICTLKINPWRSRSRIWSRTVMRNCLGNWKPKPQQYVGCSKICNGAKEHLFLENKFFKS